MPLSSELQRELHYLSQRTVFSRDKFMPPPSPSPISSDSPNHYAIRDELIDHLFVLWAIAGSIAMGLSHLRTLDFGWESRDTIYTIVVLIVIILAWGRRRLEVHVKATLFVVINTTAAVVGLVNFGLTAAISAVFPLSAIMIALFFRAKYTLWFGVLVFLVLSLAAYGFVSGFLVVTPDSLTLMSSPAHWAVYSFSMVFMVLILSQIILRFRQSMQRLYDDLADQKELLEERNSELSRALQENRALKGIIPMCSHCRDVQTPDGEWQPLQDFVLNDSGADVSHGICPSCARTHYPDFKFPSTSAES
ncbi:MAG: hypothetical protein SynsKO_30090 [Synoicihabitans sp.]